ncbi:MAG: hypothetical protein QUS09_06760 [Methanotrichaceae archaeon]|nr:hypothetical protein [Methanotrichaceae archaeon]
MKKGAPGTGAASGESQDPGYVSPGEEIRFWALLNQARDTMMSLRDRGIKSPGIAC